MIDLTTIDGILVSKLKTTSKKKVKRTCDRCERKQEIEYRSIYNARKKRNNNNDYCMKCANFLASKNKINPRPMNSNGYQYIMIGDQRISLHKHIMENHLGRSLEPHEVIHHIDGNKKNNKLDNLFLCVNQKEHAVLHDDLEKIALSLFERGVIGFDKNTKSYFLKNIETTFEKSLGFESIAIKQKKNQVSSRLDVNLQSEIIRGVHRSIPLIAANMSTVIDSQFYNLLYKLGAFGILHRAASDEWIVDEVKKISPHCDDVAVSIGVGDSQIALAKKLVDVGANIINIDIAHGYSDYLLEFAQKIKKEFNVKIVVGNTTNIEMLKECSDFADALKVGIAQGMACETKNTAGCTEKQFSAVLKFKELSRQYGIPIISDGGIREPADFTKAIAAGANSVMAGSIFAGCPESAADLIHVDDKPKKVYAGMASRYVQNKWKGGLKDGTCPEGAVRYLDLGESAASLLERYSGALRSGITYAGGIDIKSFQQSAEFIRLL